MRSGARSVSHCYSVGTKISGVETTICTLVPGNEDLAERVRKAEDGKGAKPTPSGAEMKRAVEFYQKFHLPSHHPSAPGNLVDEIRALKRDPEPPTGGDEPDEYAPNPRHDIYTAGRRRREP